MNRSPWGHPRKNQMMQDLQVLIFWLAVIGIVGFLLFPDFFAELFSPLKFSEETPTQANQPIVEDQGTLFPQSPLVFQEMYGSGKVAELSIGYWAIFVRDGQFEQLALSEEGYSFLVGLIEKDRTSGSQRLILAANGQVRQVLVSEEVYNVVSQLAVIGNRTRSP